VPVPPSGSTPPALLAPLLLACTRLEGNAGTGAKQTEGLRTTEAWEAGMTAKLTLDDCPFGSVATWRLGQAGYEGNLAQQQVFRMLAKMR